MVLEKIRTKTHTNFEIFDTITFYKGPIYKEVIGALSKIIMSRQEIKLSKKKKLFSILIELIKNIEYYSAERENNVGIGLINLFFTNQFLVCSAGNKITKEQAIILQKRFNYINKLNRSELRDYRRQSINKPFGENEGANIGLINVRLISDNLLDFDIKSINNKVFYLTLRIKVNL